MANLPKDLKFKIAVFGYFSIFSIMLVKRGDIIDRKDRKQVYTECLKEIEGSPGAQCVVYTSDPSYVEDNIPTYLIYSQEKPDTFDIELNFPIDPTREYDLPEECQIGGTLSEENILCSNCSLNRTIELAEKLVVGVAVPDSSYDIRVMPEGSESNEKVTASKLEGKLERDAFLNKEGRRDFYKECLHKVQETELDLVTGFRFKDVDFKGDEAWIQFLYQAGKETFTGNLGYQLSKESDAKKLSNKCKLEKQDPGGVDPDFDHLITCESLELKEAVDITERYFEDFCNVPEKAKPILEIYPL